MLSLLQPAERTLNETSQSEVTFCLHHRHVPLRSRIGRPLILLALLLGTAGGAVAQVSLKDIGGRGGSNFNDPCPAQQNLTGFELRVGEWVDAIRPVCVLSLGPSEISPPVLTSGSGLIQHQVSLPFGGTVNVPEVAPGWHGGPGGGIERLMCPARNPIVRAMFVQSQGDSTDKVWEVDIYCGQAAAKQPPDVLAAWVAQTPSVGFAGDRKPDDLIHWWDRQECPDGQVAVGVHGRSGKWLDAVGLICRHTANYRTA